MIRSAFDASADKLAEALHTDIGWIRQHTEYGEAARRWWRQAGRWAAAASAASGSGRILDRVAPSGRQSRPKKLRDFRRASRKRALASQRLWRMVGSQFSALWSASFLAWSAGSIRSYIAAQWRCWTVTWPYCRAGSALCSDRGEGAGAQAGRFVQGMRAGLPGDGRCPGGIVHDGIAADEEGFLRRTNIHSIQSRLPNPLLYRNMS